MIIKTLVVSTWLLLILLQWIKHDIKGESIKKREQKVKRGNSKEEECKTEKGVQKGWGAGRGALILEKADHSWDI